jgi:hypothetical protein
MKRLFVGLSVAVAFVLTALFVPAVAAADQPSCYGSSCEGRNPSDTNCVSDAQTLMGRHAKTQLTGEDLGLLELRYSPKCHSNWARFTPWHGIRSWISNGSAKAVADGSPWIWRLGVDGSLRGLAGQSSPAALATTGWTEMVTADGTTCSSVEFYETEYSNSGQGERRPLGPYNAPCIS